jgi:hypothetical protein
VTISISSTTERRIAEALERLVIEPAYENRNRVEAKTIAALFATRLAREVAGVLSRVDLRQVAPAAFTV